MEKCSRVLSFRSDKEHIFLYHLTAGKYDTADHNCTGLTYGLKNSTSLTAKQNWEIPYGEAEGNADLPKDDFILLGCIL